MMRAIAIVVLIVAACDPPHPPLLLLVSNGPAQACGSTDCADVPMTCRTWIGIRVVDPADPTAPYLSQCEEIPPNARKDLCAINRMEVQQDTLPLRDLEVQVALFPESMITFEEVGGVLIPICPADIQYDAVNGFPVETPLAPALGGRGYYREGDDQVVITLGCTSLELINEDTCIGFADVAVRASINDFDTAVNVSEADGMRLVVGVGEPEPLGADYILNPENLTDLGRTPNVNPPAWSADVEQLFSSTACLSVLEDTAGSTTTLTCRRATVTDDELDFVGVRLTRISLDKILVAAAPLGFPPQGITIGIVTDSGAPVANQVVTTFIPSTAPPGSTATIEYLSADRSTVTGTSTSGGLMGGVFVSRDAPFGTEFTTTGGLPPATIRRIGGRVAGKVTIVVLDLASGAGT